MKSIVFTVAFAFASLLQAQQGWNMLPLLPFAQPQITDLIVDNDTIIIYGDGFNNPTELKQGLLLAKIDTSGNVVATNFISDTLGDAITVSNDWGKIIKTSDGGYAATAAPYASNSAYLIKLNHNLEVTFIKEYPDTVNLSNFDYNLIEAPGGYLLFGSIQKPDYFTDCMIKYVDLEGEVIWEKIFATTNFDNRVLDIAHVTDSLFAFVTVDELAPFNFNVPSTARSSVGFINLSGEITNTWHSAADPEIGYLRKVIPLPDGSLITFGLALKQIIGTSLRVQPTLSGFDSGLSVQWIKNFGTIRGLTAFHTLWDFTATADGNFIGCGRNIAKTGNEPSRGHGWLYKFSAQGDSLWGRDIVTPFPDVYPFGGTFYGTGVLSSGNLIAGGEATDTTSRYCWIVKITNDGCMDTIFCQTTGVFETPVARLEPISVYPNPANAFVTVEAASGGDTNRMVRITTLEGSIVMTTACFLGKTIFTTAQLPPGIYVVEMMEDGHVIGRRKVAVAH